MEKRGHRKVVTGIVDSDKMMKTITVTIERLVQHPRYKKYIRKYTRIKAHDEKREAHIGDTVEVMETRPLSKTKTWRLVRVIKTANRPEVTNA